MKPIFSEVTSRKYELLEIENIPREKLLACERNRNQPPTMFASIGEQYKWKIERIQRRNVINNSLNVVFFFH